MTSILNTYASIRQHAILKFSRFAFSAEALKQMRDIILCFLLEDDCHSLPKLFFVVLHLHEIANKSTIYINNNGIFSVSADEI